MLMLIPVFLALKCINFIKKLNKIEKLLNYQKIFIKNQESINMG